MAASGILPVLKPKGPTSHDVVDELRRLYGEKRVGHAGTLDPAASGVLVAGIGKATRILRYFQLLDKRYRATIAFGAATDTLDADGQIVERAPVDFDAAALEGVLARFRGEFYQTPPMVSAVKVRGEPLYKKARRGESVKRSARRQKVYEIEMLSPPREGADGLLRAEVAVCCDSGTYVRVLAAEIARALGTVGHLENLVRIAVGPFHLDACISLEDLASTSDRERFSKLIWGTKAVPHLPVVRLDAFGVRDVSHGKRLELSPNLSDSIAREARRVLAESPHLTEALTAAGMLSEAGGGTGGRGYVTTEPGSAPSGSLLRSVSKRKLPPVDKGISLGGGTVYTGPVALVSQEGSLVAIVRPAGAMLAFDCVLV